MHVHYISGRCHPPQVGGGSVLLLILGSLIQSKVLTGFVKSQTKLLLEFKNQ
jgi:hypothetical protein